MRAALRGKPLPASQRYREFVETEQGQQQLPGLLKEPLEQ